MPVNGAGGFRADAGGGLCMRPTPTIAAIALGSNVGDRRGHIDYALDSIAEMEGTDVVATSSFHETAAVGLAGGVDPGGPYLNGAVVVRTTLAPRELLRELLRIERQRGRSRSDADKWGPRTLDLDLLVYGDLVMREADLVLPHPWMEGRSFVLEPLAEIAPGLVVPSASGRSETVAELTSALKNRRKSEYAV
jgi:2-amino-4-hydroxy-6-hydroxymethyldihydropteridine diphosphokinase